VATQFIYDLFGNVTQQSVSGITVLTATYDYLGNCLTSADGNDNTTTYTYNLIGQPRTETNAAAYNVRYWYNVMGNNKRSLDSLNKEVINSLDGWGRLLSVTQQTYGGAGAISRSTRYDVLGNPVYEIDERNNTTTYTYDKLSRPLTIKNALNQTTTITYDANGNKVAEADWLANTAKYNYDILDRLIAVIDPTGVTAETLTYTDAHRQATSTDALNHTTNFTYDNLERLTATTDAMGYSVSQTYDAVGNIITKKDGNNKITTYNYDNLNRLITVTTPSPNSAVTSYTYDNAGNVLTQTDGRGNKTSYAYNNLNQPILRADPGGIVGGVYDETRIERYTYDPDGKLKTKRDKNGITTTYGYDIHGRKTSESVGGAATTYAYDNAGNMLTVADASGTITRTYDALNRVVSKTVPTFGSTTFAYDITSGLTAGYVGESTTISGRATTRVYDKAGRLYQVKEGANVISTYAYYANGSLQTQTLPNSVTANYTYHNNNKLHTLQNKKGATIVEAYQYTYDGAGNMTAKQDVKGTTTYTYTSINQLATVNEPGGKQTSYSYDLSGNRLSETVTASGQSITTNYTVNEQNRLLTTEQTTTAQSIIEQYFYDDAGNMLGRRPETLTAASGATASLGLAQLGQTTSNYLTPAIYSYNNKNQMVEAKNGDNIITNTFNAEGLRVSKTADGITTYYCYEYNQVIKEQDSTGSVAYNTYGTNLISREVDGSQVYYLYNGHGDVTGLLSNSGTIIASYYYDAFGNIVEESGSFGNPYRYAGYMYDSESSLYNLNARFYDAKLARFMQEDTHWNTNNMIYGDNPHYIGNNPVSSESALMQSLNLYTYLTFAPQLNPLIQRFNNKHLEKHQLKHRSKIVI
jgi:RHS repeat-associated protein